MTLTLFSVCIAALILIAATAAFSHHRRRSTLPSGWTSVDLRAMSRLFSTEDDRFLADNVPWYVLINLRFKRALAAEDYIARLRDNSRYAIAVGRFQNDAALLDAAAALRIELAKLQVKVWAGVVSPIHADLDRVSALTGMFATRSKLSAVPAL